MLTVVHACTSLFSTSCLAVQMIVSRPNKYNYILKYHVYLEHFKIYVDCTSWPPMYNHINKIGLQIFFIKMGIRLTLFLERSNRNPFYSVLHKEQKELSFTQTGIQFRSKETEWILLGQSFKIKFCLPLPCRTETNSVYSDP